MVEKCVAPSKLHLKKELNVLQKARFLRDPETSSSWRSPLSSKSFAAYNLCHQNDIRDVSTRENISSVLLEIPPRSEKSRKKVYLYNWKNHSSKSSENGIKLDEDGNQPSVESSLEDSVSGSHKEGIVGDRYLLPSANICNARDSDLGVPPRKSGTRFKKIAILNKRGINDGAISNLMDLQSSPLGVPSSVEQSDDTGHCNTEDARQMGLDLFCKATHCSPSHSCTPASTSSYYRHISRKPSTAGSLDGTSASFEGDEFDQLDLTVRQGCGLPCYWSKKTKDRGCRGCYSPKLCGSQKMYDRKRSNVLGKPKHLSKSSRGPPLLTDNCDDISSDELSTSLGELDLEALSRLDGRRWSSSKSQEASEAAGPGAVALDIADNKSLSIKYKPRTFDEIIGQKIVVQSLVNAVLKRKVAPAYLFHGPHGTGKTSVARIFSAALNCLATEGKKPCCLCKACTASHGERGLFVREVSATNKTGIDKVRYLLKNMTMTSRLFQYRIFIIDECHVLTSKMWSSFLRIFEEPISHVVFIFITIDHENLPRAILSHCQKYQFSKIKDADVIRRLSKLSAAENLEVEMDALNMIAVNSDGSLQDAETMLYQASLLGKRITTALVSDLVGVVSDEKLLDLLELAMSSKAEETVKRSRELIDSGVDPIFLASQLAGLMMDIIAGTYRLAHSQHENVVLGGRSLTKDELKRLQQALKILSDAEKQLKQSNEHSSLLTTALLQLASGHNMESTQPNSVGIHGDERIKGNAKKISSSDCNRSHSLLATRESSSALVPSKMSKKFTPNGCQKSFTMLKGHDLISNDVSAKVQSTKRSSSNKTHLDSNANGSPCNLSEIWRSCIGKCYSKTLRQLLSSHGKLVSVTAKEGVLIAFIAFADSSMKLRAERYLTSITNSLELVLKQNVEVTMGLIPDNWKSPEPSFDSLTIQHMEKLGFLDNQRKIISDGMKDLPDKDGETLSFPRKSRDASVGSRHRRENYSNLLAQNVGLPVESFSVSAEGNNGSGTKEKGTEIAILTTHSQVSNEKILENAWLQAAEKVAPDLPNLLKTKTNQSIPQNSGSSQLYCDPLIANDRPSRHWEDEPNHEIKAPETNDIRLLQKEKSSEDKNYRAISPSALHSNNFGTNLDKQNSEYESAPGCTGLFCWKSNRPHRRQVKQGTHFSYHKTRHMFGKRVKSKTRGNRLGR